MYYDQKESGKRIAKLRKKKGLTQEQLAEKLSISYSLLAKVESGSRAASIDLLVEMKAFFNTTLDYLALGIEPMTEPSKHEDIERYLGRVTRQEMFGINRALLVSLDLNTSSRQ